MEAARRVLLHDERQRRAAALDRATGRLRRDRTVALISLVCVVALTDAGTQVNNIFTSIKNKLTTAAAAAP